MREDYQTSVQQEFKNEGKVLSSKMNGEKEGKGKERRYGH